MRTVTFSNPEVAAAVNRACVSAWRNRIPEFHDCDPHTEEWIARSNPNAYPTRNIVTFFMTPRFQVIHYFTGYFAPKTFLDELSFALKVREEIFNKDFQPRPGAAGKFRHLHLEHQKEHLESAKPSSADHSRSEGLTYIAKVHKWFSARAPADPKLALEALLFDHIWGNSFEETRGRQDPAREREVETAILKFSKTMADRKATEEDKIEAIKEVAEHRNVRVLDALNSYLFSTELSFRIVTARELGKFKGVKDVEAILLKALPKQEKENVAVQIMIIRSLGTLKAESAVETLNRLISDPQVWIAKAAVDAAGKIREKSSLTPLIRELKNLASKEGNTIVLVRDPAEEMLRKIMSKQGLPDLPKQENNASSSRREILRQPILDALKSITHQDFSTAQEWDRWWKANRTLFEVPK